AGCCSNSNLFRRYCLSTRPNCLERVLKIGSAGDSPAPVGDPPTGTAESNLGESASLSARTVASIPSGESPDGTGGWPVLPKTIFQIRSKSIYSFLRAPRLL